jgi:hypothetical protein
MFCTAWRELFEEVVGMTRLATGLCVAAALSCALNAQTPSTSTSAGQRTSADNAREVTITGCLSKGADGKYILTNAKLDNPAGATAGTSGSTTPTPATTPGTSTGAAASNMATSWALSGGTDLDKHVGHKIQVTGKAAAMDSMDHRNPDTTEAAAGATPANPATAASPTASAVGTSGSTATAAAEEQRNKSANANQPRLDVSSVKMIAATCS